MSIQLERTRNDDGWKVHGNGQTFTLTDEELRELVRIGAYFTGYPITD